MKILYLPKYNSDGPSSRYRTFQYIPFFQDKGIHCKVISFYPNGYVKNLYKKKWLNLIVYPFCILKRLLIIIFSFQFDLIVIEKEAIPYFPPIAEKILSLYKKKFILDYDDAIYYNYIYSSNVIVRKLFSKKIIKIMNLASGIITGSPELTMYARQLNSRVVEFPTSLDMNRYKPTQQEKNKDTFVIGWIGSISTSKYIDTISLALKKFIQEYIDVEIHLVGYTGSLDREIKRVKVIQWTSNTEVEELHSIDVGIMPLIDTPFEHGKCGFKLIQYMACGKPTISSPFEANLKIDGGVGNLFASSNEEWYDCLSKIYLHKSLFKKIGEKNKERVISQYTIQANVEKYIKFYQDIQRS